MNGRNFPLGSVLTVTTGRTLCEVGQIYEILNFMTGDNLFTHQLPRASEECTEPLLKQHPQLADVVVPETINSWETCNAWLATQTEKFGAELHVQQLAPNDHTRIDPLTELAQMTDKPIITVVVDGGDDT